MAKFRTKPFEIEAVKFEGSAKTIKDAFPDIALEVYAPGGGDYLDYIKVWDYLQQTWVQINLFDYVIKGMKGEYYPCDPEVFEAKYEEIVERPGLHYGHTHVAFDPEQSRWEEDGGH